MYNVGWMDGGEGFFGDSQRQETERRLQPWCGACRRCMIKRPRNSKIISHVLARVLW